MKIGFAIACYDKFEEVEVLSEILKKNFNKIEATVCVGSNHPEAHQKFSTNPNIDYIVDGDDIPLEVHTSKARFDVGFENSVVSIMRTLSNTNAAVLKLLDSQCEYIISLHSDSWLLKENNVIEIIETMEANNKPFAFRGFNVFYSSFYGPHKEFYLVDFLMFIKREYCQSHNIFDFNTYSMLPGEVNNAHSSYFWQILVKVGLENAWCYSDTRNLVFWDNKPVYWIKYLAPFCFDVVHHQVHINVGSFHDQLGEALQCHYLKRYQFTGEYINKFLSKYEQPEDEMFGKLGSYDRKYRRKLKWYFGNFENSGLSRSHKYLERYLAATPWYKIYKDIAFRKMMLRRNRSYNLIQKYRKAIPPSKLEGRKVWYETFYVNDRQ